MLLFKETIAARVDQWIIRAGEGSIRDGQDF